MNRINLTNDELEYLKDLINDDEINFIIENDVIHCEPGAETIREKINNPIKINKSEKKINSMKIATAAREKQTKEKIENAINIIRFQDLEKVNFNTIAKIANVSYVSVKKYVSEDLLKSLNK